MLLIFFIFSIMILLFLISFFCVHSALRRKMLGKIFIDEYSMSIIEFQFLLKFVLSD